ncbi:MAG TPA: large conductance mechanosensitive channel protein MscL [Candidatus Paceibacterota bacterium]|nr:large conductance mechanosensitive channel protein MscL [Candidatus Paceibacterota bacterium]
MILDKTRGFFAEFRTFAVKGNAFDLAIAVVIGNAFSAIVNSLVGDIITPLIGLVTPGSSDLKNMSVSVGQPIFNTVTGTTTQPVVVHYGSFLAAIVNFLLITLSIFVVFKLLAAARKRVFREGEKAVPPAEKPAQERLLEEIRDLLKEKK